LRDGGKPPSHASWACGWLPSLRLRLRSGSPSLRSGVWPSLSSAALAKEERSRACRGAVRSTKTGSSLVYHPIFLCTRRRASAGLRFFALKPAVFTSKCRFISSDLYLHGFQYIFKSVYPTLPGGLDEKVYSFQCKDILSIHQKREVDNEHPQ